MRRAAALLLLALFPNGAAAPAEQVSVYRVTGEDARLFDQYDNDGYSLAVRAAEDGTLELTVRVSDAPLRSAAPFPTGFARDAALPSAPDRDALARRLASGSPLQAEAVEKVLLGLASRVRYDPDRLRRQDPAAVFVSGRAHCVGFAELAVDLLLRLAIPARTVQGVLRTGAAQEGYEAAIGGAYHRWIEVYYADRGFVFSDPFSSINGVDARYIPFTSRSLFRPGSLAIVPVAASGQLLYAPVRAGEATLRVRAVSR